MFDPSDRDALKRAFSAFATGVTVVGTLDDTGAPRGLTASAFTPVSLTPPILLVCIGYNTRTSTVFAKSEQFAVSILKADQADISTRFATKDNERFEVTPWEKRATGAPVLRECAAWFDCLVRDRVDAGDHFILLGDIEAIGVDESDPNPLGYFRSQYGDVTLREQA